MNSSEIPFLSATELASYIEKKQISPVEAVEAYLSRIEQVNPKLNAYITLCAEEMAGVTASSVSFEVLSGW